MYGCCDKVYCCERGPRGHRGPQGEQGSRGPRGCQGPQGESGPRGKRGFPGETGPAGPQGEEGPVGPQGEEGPVGPQGEEGPVGPQGEQGPVGPQGEQGPVGPQGEEGPVGPQGEPGPGAIIPFASGREFKLGTITGGEPGVPAFIGFGISETSTNVLGTTINLKDELSTYAFSVPRSGTITSFSALFSTTSPNNFVNTTVTIYAQIYIGSTANNIFTPIPDTLLELQPSFTGNVTKGSIASGILDNLDIDVEPEDRLLLVYFIRADGQVEVQNVLGHASAGLVIG